MRLVLASRGGVSLCVSFPRLVVGFSLWHLAVSSFVSRLVFVLASGSWRMRGGVAWMSLSSCGQGGGVSISVFLIGSAGERHEVTGMRRFIQLILIRIRGGGFALMA